MGKPTTIGKVVEEIRVSKLNSTAYMISLLVKALMMSFKLYHTKTELSIKMKKPISIKSSVA